MKWEMRNMLSPQQPTINNRTSSMIGIQEDVLNMFLISHFMILFSVGGLVFAFTLLLCLKMNSGLGSSAPRSAGWFGVQNRRAQPAPVVIQQPSQGRGWFFRN